MKPANRKFTRPNNYSNNDGQRRHSGGGGGNNRNATASRERYNNLAREALASGDRILAEYYFQHAEHYFRVMMEEGSRPNAQGGQNGQNGQGAHRRHHNNAAQPSASPEGATSEIPVAASDAVDTTGNVHYIAPEPTPTQGGVDIPPAALPANPAHAGAVQAAGNAAPTPSNNE